MRQWWLVFSLAALPPLLLSGGVRQWLSEFSDGGPCKKTLFKGKEPYGLDQTEIPVDHICQCFGRQCFYASVLSKNRNIPIYWAYNIHKKWRSTYSNKDFVSRINDWYIGPRDILGIMRKEKSFITQTTSPQSSAVSYIISGVASSDGTDWNIEDLEKQPDIHRVSWTVYHYSSGRKTFEGALLQKYQKWQQINIEQLAQILTEKYMTARPVNFFFNFLEANTKPSIRENLSEMDKGSDHPPKGYNKPKTMTIKESPKPVNYKETARGHSQGTKDKIYKNGHNKEDYLQPHNTHNRGMLHPENVDEMELESLKMEVIEENSENQEMTIILPEKSKKLQNAEGIIKLTKEEENSKMRSEEEQFKATALKDSSKPANDNNHNDKAAVVHYKEKVDEPSFENPPVEDIEKIYQRKTTIKAHQGKKEKETRETMQTNHVEGKGEVKVYSLSPEIQKPEKNEDNKETDMHIKHLYKNGESDGKQEPDTIHPIEWLLFRPQNKSELEDNPLSKESYEKNEIKEDQQEPEITTPKEIPENSADITKEYYPMQEVDQNVFMNTENQELIHTTPGEDKLPDDKKKATPREEDKSRDMKELNQGLAHIPLGDITESLQEEDSTLETLLKKEVDGTTLTQVIYNTHTSHIYTTYMRELLKPGSEDQPMEDIDENGLNTNRKDIATDKNQDTDVVPDEEATSNKANSISEVHHCVGLIHRTAAGLRQCLERIFAMQSHTNTGKKASLTENESTGTDLESKPQTEMLDQGDEQKKQETKVDISRRKSLGNDSDVITFGNDKECCQDRDPPKDGKGNKSERDDSEKTIGKEASHNTHIVGNSGGKEFMETEIGRPQGFGPQGGTVEQNENKDLKREEFKEEQHTSFDTVSHNSVEEEKDSHFYYADGKIKASRHSLDVEMKKTLRPCVGLTHYRGDCE